jgi:hypothetical protein
VRHGAMNSNGNGQLSGIRNKKNSVLHESDTAALLDAHGTSDGGVHTVGVGGRHQQKRALLKKNPFTTGLRNILPVESVDVLALPVLTSALLLTRLEFRDLKLGTFHNTRLEALGQMITHFPLSFLDQG